MFRLQNNTAKAAATDASNGLSSGMRLRQLRERLGFTIRDVEAASHVLADRLGKPEYCLPLSRLSDIESKDVVPGIHKLCSLSLIYRRSIDELLSYFGIDLSSMALRMGRDLPWPHTDTIVAITPKQVEVPLMDPGFNPQRTMPGLRHIQRWGILPAAHLKTLAESGHEYALIGSEDRMMYPFLRPGTLVQIDPNRTEIVTSGWKNEYDRPLYFVETRDGYYCCWVSVASASKIVLQPHPLSTVAPVVLRHPDEAEIVGRVVGIAMRLDEPQPGPRTAEYRA
jgi:transcriptional regulator with XRE-family HTH domain